MTIEKQIGFIGGGNMAEALIEGLIKSGASRSASMSAPVRAR